MANIIDLIDKIKGRAGLTGDPYYQDPDEILSVLQTAFELHWFKLASYRPAEIEREASITGASTVSLPADCAIVRALIRDSDGVTLHRISKQDLGGTSTSYDSDSSTLYCGAGLNAVALTLAYIPTAPTLARTGASQTVWTSIDERLFPENSIVLYAMSELLAKDEDPRSTFYHTQAQELFSVWLDFVKSGRITVSSEGSSSVASIVNQVLGLNQNLKPDHATEHAVLSALQQGVERIHRGIEIAIESVLRKKMSGSGAYTSPTNIVAPSDLHDILLVLVKVGTVWKTCLNGDFSTDTATTRKGAYFYSYDNLGVDIKLFWNASETNPTDYIISYLTRPPTLTLDGTIDAKLYPRDLLVDYTLGQLQPEPDQKDQKQLQAQARFQQALSDFVMTLRGRYIFRGNTDPKTRSGLLAAIRSVLGSGRESEWRDQVLELQIDLVKEEIARLVRNTYQGFYESDKQYTLSQEVTSLVPTDFWMQIIQVKFLTQGLTDVTSAVEITKLDQQRALFQFVAGFWDNQDQTLVFSGNGLGPGTVIVKMVEPPANIVGDYSQADLNRLVYPPDLIINKVIARVLLSPGAPNDSRPLGEYYEKLSNKLVSQHLISLNTLFRRERINQRLAYPMPRGRFYRSGYSHLGVRY